MTTPPDPTAQQASSSASPRPLRILVADDYADGRDMMALLLTCEGHTVEKAADGMSALMAAGTFRPDVAILDIGMPGMTGYAVAEALRREPTATPLVLVALSGLGQREDKARAAQAGFDRHFTKPVDVALLREFLSTVRPRVGD